MHLYGIGDNKMYELGLDHCKPVNSFTRLFKKLHVSAFQTVVNGAWILSRGSSMFDEVAKHYVDVMFKFSS